MSRPDPANGTVLCVIPGPTHVYAVDPDDRPDRWCFKCRRRLPGEWHYIGDPPEIESWYDPQWVYVCSGCGEDHHYFPGCWPL